MELQNWLDLQGLNGVIDSQILSINNQKYFILEVDKGSPIIDERFQFLFSVEQGIIISDNNIEQVVIQFGSKWYYSPIEEPKFSILKYIKEDTDKGFDLPYLGIHGKYDICNGSRDYEDWCVKAKFLGINTLGICESNTLAGTLSFQTACTKAGVKPILGETITVQCNDIQYKIKLYCINEQGWRNLLNINAQIKVFNDGYVNEDHVIEKHNGLICVIDCSTKLNNNLIQRYKAAFNEDLYYQFDPVEWSSPQKEEGHLSLMKDYINNYASLIPPVLICDSYYLDQDESHIRALLNKIGKVGFQNQSTNQWFKSINDVVIQLDELFQDVDRANNFINLLIDNTTNCANKCEFKIKLGELHLPQYELTSEEKVQYENSKDLFWNLIQQGLEEKIIGKVEDDQIYIDRIQMEVGVIEKGGLIDYFLITWDFLNWAKKNDILTSMGRGSAAGSLVSYLLNITKLDPIKYDLLFERFLSEARLGKVEKRELIIVHTQDGDIELDVDQKISIFREEEQLIILAQDLQIGDELDK